MYEFLNIKEKLKKDMKFILHYQMITGTPLNKIVASTTFDDLQKEMDQKTPGIFNYYTRKEYSLDKDFNSTKEVYTHKQLKIFKDMKNNPINEFIVRFTDCDNEQQRITDIGNIDEMVNVMIENKLLSKDNRIIMDIYRTNTERTLDVEVRYGYETSKKKLFEHLKTDIKTVLQYNLSGFGTASEIIRFKTTLQTMKSRMNGDHKLRFVYNKKFDSIYDLMKVNVSGLQNHSIKLTLMNGRYNKFDVDGLDTYEKILEYVEKRKREDGVKLAESWIMLRKNILHLEDGNDYIETQTIIELVFGDIKSEMNESDFSKHLPEFNGYTFTHGLAAYNDCMKLTDKLNKLKDNGITLCCCWDKEYVGDYGLYIQGECIHASLYDLSSRYDKNNKGGRIIDYSIYYNKGSITSPKQIIMSDDMNGEALVKNFTIVGIWVRRSYFKVNKNNTYKIINILAIKQKLGKDLPITIVDDSDMPAYNIYHGNKTFKLGEAKPPEIKEMKMLL